MAQQQPITSIRERDPKKLATTTITNEIVRAISGGLNVPTLGSPRGGVPHVPVSVRIDSAAKAKGGYNCTLVEFALGKDKSADLVINDFGIRASSAKPPPIPVFAWCLDDAGSGSWSLSNGTVTNGYIVDVLADGRPVVLLSRSATSLHLIKITSAAGMGGAYNTRTLTPPTNPIDVTTGTFSETTIGTTPNADDSYAINLQEITKSTHDLADAGNTNQRFFVAMDWCLAKDKKPIRMFNGFWTDTCPASNINGGSA